MSKYITLTILFSFFSFINYSQLAVKEFENKSFSFNDQDSVFNIQVDCDSRAFGYFLSDTNTLEINQGLVLSTGKICSLIGPNLESGVSTNLSYVFQSNWHDSINGYDLCIVEFDYITLKDSVKFNIQFGSEEYPKFVNTIFADFFNIYLSGNEFQEPKHIAKISNENISVNSVNAAVNNNFYIDNSSKSLNVEFNGLTKKISVKEKITPNLKYHLTFVIGDVGDAINDSGVFIETFDENFIADSLNYVKCFSSDSSFSTNPIMEIDSATIKFNPPSIFPNPCENSLSFAINDNSLIDISLFENEQFIYTFIDNFILTFKIRDELGKEILTEDLKFHELVFENGYIRPKKPIDASELKKGLYFLEIQSKVIDGDVYSYSYISKKHFFKFIKK